MWTAPIVGMSFRSPASEVVRNLPSGTELLVHRQPENPYDENACAVFLFGFSEDGQHSELYSSLIEQQTDPDERAKYVDPLMLGFIDSKKTGKAKELSQFLLGQEIESIPGALSFSMDGKPQIEIDIEVKNETA
jgi:hypothetical protein